jgi:hypothetical protein
MSSPGQSCNIPVDIELDRFFNIEPGDEEKSARRRWGEQQSGLDSTYSNGSHF